MASGVGRGGSMVLELPANGTAPPTVEQSERDRVRLEFYATYDVMTGVRIAATLGGFFALMVLLVLYKSRSKSVKAMKDPEIVKMAEAAVAEEVAEEEERELVAALESAHASLTRLSFGDTRRWGDARIWDRTPRFSSVGGGYDALLRAPRRQGSGRGDSLPASVLRFDTRDAFTEDILVEDDGECHLLAVPPEIRRLSSVTCSSSGSSYLERRGSSIVCALPTLPPKRRSPFYVKRRAAGLSDIQNPIDIQVIQATPELSPCVSERTLNSRLPGNAQVGSERRAPLASIGSCNVSFSFDCQDCDALSVGPDSVFADEETETDDEVEPFSTDSDSEAVLPRDTMRSSCKIVTTRRRESLHSSGISRHHSCISKPITKHLLRRLSQPAIVNMPSCATISASVAEKVPSAHRKATQTEENFVSLKKSDKMFILSSVQPSTLQGSELGKKSNENESTELLSKVIPPLDVENISWSQETLF